MIEPVWNLHLRMHVVQVPLEWLAVQTSSQLDSIAYVAIVGVPQFRPFVVEVLLKLVHPHVHRSQSIE